MGCQGHSTLIALFPMVRRLGLERGVDPVNAGASAKGYSPDAF
jgi:hypothetical protein